jgi:prephenate dehydrogenase
MPRLAIIGLGLIGGSLGLALKRAQLEELEIVGHDAEWGVNGRARKLGAIDREARSVTEAAEGTAVVVIATPILHVATVLEELAPVLAEGALVTDTASTKRDVMRWASELLPETVNFVGGHPIAGKEQSGLEAADAALFEGRPWAISASSGASEQAVRTVENLVAAVGAHPVPIDPEEHDAYLAAVSHLPLLAATALFSLVSGSQAWPELAALAGPGFRDTTRLASTSPDLSHDLSLTNRDNLLHWLDRFGEELARLRRLIEDGKEQEELLKTFAKAQAARDAFTHGLPERPGRESEADKVSAGERMLSFMVGDYVVRRTKELEEILRRRETGEDDGLRRKLDED